MSIVYFQIVELINLKTVVDRVDTYITLTVALFPEETGCCIATGHGPYPWMVLHMSQFFSSSVAFFTFFLVIIEVMIARSISFI